MKTISSSLTAPARSPSSKAFIKDVLAEEHAVFIKTNIRDRLGLAMQSATGLKAFAEAFYFVRVGFVQLNFLVGSRCSSDEVYWGGLARNLFEELGGNDGPSHNELYRWFLRAAGATEESKLRRCAFAARFEDEWVRYCKTVPIIEALSALAIYEIYDNPDYAMLNDVVRSSGIRGRGLVFFGVHANARHFELFEDLYKLVARSHQGMLILTRARAFVLKTQEMMWEGLVSHVEKRSKTVKI